MATSSADLKTFSEVQELHLRLMELASFNRFDGQVVVKDLREQHDLWQAAVLWRDFEFHQFVWLRDMPKGSWNVDKLYIIPVVGREFRLLRLVYRWMPDTVESIPAPTHWRCFDHLPKKIYQVWWD